MAVWTSSVCCESYVQQLVQLAVYHGSVSYQKFTATSVFVNFCNRYCGCKLITLYKGDVWPRRRLIAVAAGWARRLLTAVHRSIKDFRDKQTGPSWCSLSVETSYRINCCSSTARRKDRITAPQSDGWSLEHSCSSSIRFISGISYRRRSLDVDVIASQL